MKHYTVKSCFESFNAEYVNLDSAQYEKALKSRDNLLTNIHNLAKDEKIAKIYPEKDIKFGSFARRTKIRPLDDIDLMVCFSADGSSYIEETTGVIKIKVDDEKSKLYEMTDGGYLNSRKFIEHIKAQLVNLNDYSKSEIRRNHEVITLQLKSYTWNFDIVPCFFTVTDFYLIPDGNGNWKKTDPRKDQERVTTVNQNNNGNVLQLIRTMTYWKKKYLNNYLSSYAFEQMILDYCDNNSVADSFAISIMSVLSYCQTAIYNSIDDPKGFQENLNDLDYESKKHFSEISQEQFLKAFLAVLNQELNKEDKAIELWQEIFGKDFE